MQMKIRGSTEVAKGEKKLRQESKNQERSSTEDKKQ